jgi:CHAT domain-containing protein/Flp pilus assembly protein TadD
MRVLKQPLLVSVLIGVFCFNIEAQAQSTTDFDEFANTLLATPSDQERQNLLSQKKDLLTPDLRKALIRQGNTHLMAGRYSTAFEIYDLAKHIAQRIGDKEGVASAALDIGTVYYFQANYPAALEHYKEARELFIEVTNNYESAKALSGLALIYKEQRRDAEALSALQQALKEFKSLGDKEEIGNTLNSIGTIYYGLRNYDAAADAFLKSSEANNNADNLVRLADALYMQGDFALSLKYYKESLDKLDESREVAGVIAALNGAANSAYYQGNYEEALQYYERNIPIQEAQRDRLGVATSLKGVGNIHRSRGEYPSALEVYFKSLAISEQIKAPTGSILGSIGLVRALQGNYEAALVSYQKALTEFEEAGNKIDMARSLSLIGNVHYAQGNYEAALTSYRRALVLREAMDDKVGQGDILSGMGSAYLRQKNYADALDSYQKALVLFDTAAAKDRMADVLSRVAETFIAQNEFTKALSSAESSIAIAKQIDDGNVLWYAQLLAAKAHRGLDHASVALQSVTESIGTVESLRDRPPSLAIGDHNSYLPYLSGVDLLMSQHRPGEAFDYAERAKTQYLIELLRTSNAASTKGLTVTEQAEERRLAGEVASSELQLDRISQLRSASDTRRAELREHLKQSQTAYREFRKKLSSDHPGLRIDRGENAALTVNEMGALVGDSQTALLEYTITERNTYLFVLTADRPEGTKTSRRRLPLSLNLKVYPLDVNGNELSMKLREFERLLSTKSDDSQQSARDLYDMLLRPAEDQLVLKTKLVIVPDGVLWRLPFEALQPADDHYVVDQMQVSYAQSLSILRDLRSRRVPVNRLKASFVGIGNPLLSSEFKARVQLGYPDTILESSAAQEDEVKRLGAVFGSSRTRLLTAAEASEERLKADAAGANILHISSPSLLDDTSAMSSFVGLAAAPGKQNEGFMQAREIMNLQATVDLVVLSGAQQKSGFSGAGILGMTWAWFAAGSSSTIFNRWQADPVASNQLMIDFYSRIKPGTRSPDSKAVALRQSVLSLRRNPDYQHPYYWASFAMIGDSR